MEQSSDTDSCSDVFDRLKEAETEIMELSRSFAERQHFKPSYPLISQSILRQQWPSTTPEPPPTATVLPHKEESLTIPETATPAVQTSLRRPMNVKPSASSSGTLTTHSDKLIQSSAEMKKASKCLKVYPSKSADWVEKPLEAAIRQSEEDNRAKESTNSENEPTSQRPRSNAPNHPQSQHSSNSKTSPQKTGMKLITGSPPVIVHEKPSSAAQNNPATNSPRSSNKPLHSVHEDPRKPSFGDNRDPQQWRRDGPRISPGDAYRKSVFYPKDDFKAKSNSLPLAIVKKPPSWSTYNNKVRGKKFIPDWDAQSTSTTDTKTDQQPPFYYNEEAENSGRFPSRRFRKGKIAPSFNEPSNQNLNNQRGCNQQIIDNPNTSNQANPHRPFSGTLNNANFPKLDGSSLGGRRDSQSSISESFASSSRPDTASSRCSASVSQHSLAGRPNSGLHGHHPKSGPSYQPNSFPSPSPNYRPSPPARATGPHGIYSKPWSHQHGEATSTGSRVFSQSKTAPFNKAVGADPTVGNNMNKNSLQPRFASPHHNNTYQAPSSPSAYYEQPMTSPHPFYDTTNIPPIQTEAGQSGTKGVIEGGDVNVKRHCRTGSTTSQSGKPCTCPHNKGAAVTSVPVAGPGAPPWNAVLGNFYQQGVPPHPMYVFGSPQPDFLQDLTTPEGKIRRARLLDKRLNDMLRSQFGFRRDVTGQTAWMPPATAMQNNFGLVVGQEF